MQPSARGRFSGVFARTASREITKTAIFEALWSVQFDVHGIKIRAVCTILQDVWMCVATKCDKHSKRSAEVT